MPSVHHEQHWSFVDRTLLVLLPGQSHLAVLLEKSLAASTQLLLAMLSLLVAKETVGEGVPASSQGRGHSHPAGWLESLLADSLMLALVLPLILSGLLRVQPCAVKLLRRTVSTSIIPRRRRSLPAFWRPLGRCGL